MSPRGLGDIDLDELATRTLERVGARAEATVYVWRLKEGLTRFANSFIHQNVGDEQISLTVQLAADGRTASSTTTDVSDEAVARLVDTTLEAASLQPVDEEWPDLAPPSPLIGNPRAHYDQATAEAGPGPRAEIVAAFVAAGDGLEAAGYCETAASHDLLVNSRGQRIEATTTSATVDGIHRLGRADGCGSARSTRLGDLDGEAVGAIAADAARRGRDVIELPPGRYEVILEPRSVAYMLDFFTVYGFNARAVREGQSFVSPGEVQLDPSLSLWDDATDSRHVGLGFDVEGTPKRRVDLVEDGRVVGVTHDRRTAAKAGGGTGSTGHAIPGGASFGAVATNVFLAGRTPTPTADLIANVKRGLLIRDFWYPRVLDPKSLVVTGLTRNGVFLIEDGHIGPAVSNMRFTQSPVAAFGPGQVLGVGDDAALAPGGLHVSWHHAPTLHLAAWNLTGNASG